MQIEYLSMILGFNANCNVHCRFIIDTTAYYSDFNGNHNEDKRKYLLRIGFRYMHKACTQQLASPLLVSTCGHYSNIKALKCVFIPNKCGNPISPLKTLVKSVKYCWGKIWKYLYSSAIINTASFALFYAYFSTNILERHGRKPMC